MGGPFDTDPFADPRSQVADWTTRLTGQYNQKVVDGPGTGAHRFYVPDGSGRAGQTGTERPFRDQTPPVPHGE